MNSPSDTMQHKQAQQTLPSQHPVHSKCHHEGKISIVEAIHLTYSYMQHVLSILQFSWTNGTSEHGNCQLPVCKSVIEWQQRSTVKFWK